VDITNRTPFAANWRPLAGWVCTLAIGYSSLLYPALVWVGLHPPLPPTDDMFYTMLSLLGLAGLRTGEKLTEARLKAGDIE